MQVVSMALSMLMLIKVKDANLFHDLVGPFGNVVFKWYIS